MANSVSGGQLNTYSPVMPAANSTTAATQGLIIYAVSAAGIQGGVTNSPTSATLGTVTNVAFQGITHFNNVAGNNGLYMGPAGKEIPMVDKQETIVTICTVSAATVTWAVVPFNCTIGGYWTQDQASPAAALNNQCLIYSGSAASGALLATISNATAGNPGDTYPWYTTTVNTVITGGTPISFNFNTTAIGTAYGQYVTAVLTRVGI
jgi:hypothetical protein